MEPSSPQPPVPSRLRLVPWAVLPIAALPLLLLLASPQSAVARMAIAAGEAFRAISLARLFEGGNPAPSALTLAVLDWQSLTGIGLLGVGLLAIAASIFHTRDWKPVARTLLGVLAVLILPAVIGGLLIGPAWAGYAIPTRHMEMTHFMLAGGGWILGQTAITMAVALWTKPADQVRWPAAGPSAASGPVTKRRQMSTIVLGSSGLETALRLLPILLALAAWAVLRFEGALPDALLFALIDGGFIVRPLALPELIGWSPRLLAGLDPLQDAMVLAFRDWQGFALSLALVGAIALLFLEGRRALPDQRLMGFLKSAFGLGLFGAFFYWFMGDSLRSSIDPATWQPEIATMMVLFSIFALMAGKKPKQGTV